LEQNKHKYEELSAESLRNIQESV